MSPLLSEGASLVLQSFVHENGIIGWISTMVCVPFSERYRAAAASKTGLWVRSCCATAPVRPDAVRHSYLHIFHALAEPRAVMLPRHRVSHERHIPVAEPKCSSHRPAMAVERTPWSRVWSRMGAGCTFRCPIEKALRENKQ